MNLTEHERKQIDMQMKGGDSTEYALICLLFERTEQLLKMINKVDERVVNVANRNPLFK